MQAKETSKQIKRKTLKAYYSLVIAKAKFLRQRELEKNSKNKK